ncbi:hypothetical protein [Myxococcus sp. NMCA1]|uniref:hypothetical protein n=1 Tax=Myxococcus sp. NMCA1 TaxID=2996785 RepID=UPI00228620AF|nr:hypothetical protein [Myxococcus sp. NMCA1]WAM23808.1 hypothetical protein OZ403_25035 [Myxococcus sp. NMCA1]
MRSREKELQGGIDVDVTPGEPNPRLLKPRYFDIRWTHVETLPTHLLLGFSVAVYEGDDPNNTDAYLLEPVRVGPSERRAVVSLRVATTVEVKCAVQALYSNGTQSSWRVLGGAVAADPDMVKLATADLKNVPAAAAQEASRNAVGAFTESFERSPFDLGNWERNPLLAPPAASLVSGQGYSGGNVLRCTNAVWIYSTVKLPYDPTKLYRLRCRVRQFQEPTSGGKAVYCGLVGWAADGVTMVNAAGLNDLGSQHYYCISGAVLPASTGYSEFTGWVKGLSANVTENWPSQDPRNPRPMHQATRYVSLVLIANLDAGNGVTDFDSAVVDVFDESATPRVYTALNPDGSISYNVGISDGSGAPRTIAKGRQAQLAAHGAYVAFNPPFQNTPMVLLRGGLTHEPRAKWGATGSGSETGAYNTALPTYDDTQAIMNGGSGFTLRARLRQRGGTVTARTNNPASSSNLATGIGSTVEVVLSNAPATNDQYALRFNAIIYLLTPPRTGEMGAGGSWEPGSAQGSIVVALDSLDVGQSWVERATTTLWANSNNNTVNWVQSVNTHIGEVLTAAAPGLGAADRLRLRIKSVSVPPGSNQPTAHVWHSSVDAGAGVTYSTSTDQYASKTPDVGDMLYWEALDA